MRSERGLRGPASLLALAAVVAACDPGAGRSATVWQARMDTLGDTVVVRTVAGSEWRHAELVPEVRIGALEGEPHEMLGAVRGLAVGPDGHVYVYDGQVPALRRYTADGDFVGTLGRQGGGPGEYRNSDGGIIALPDGRVVIRDPGNARFTAYGPDGGYLSSWPAQGGMFTGTPLLPTPEGGFLNHVFGPGLTGVNLVRHAPDGSPVDTLQAPRPEVPLATVEGRSPDGQAFQRWGVPFAPTAVWSMTSDGEFLTGRTDLYAIDRHRADGTTLRIEREVEPVAVTAGERAAEEDRVATAMRRLDPGWRWDGPRIASTKPFFRQIFAGDDGRVWVLLHRPGDRSDEEPEPGPDGRRAPARYVEPIVFDLFESDGRYLGPVTAPDGFSLSPWPVFGAGQVWAVTRDDMDVQYVVRYRLVVRD